MGMVFKCDRCGDVDLNGGGGSTGRGGVVSLEVANSLDGQSVPKMDLCRSCTRELCHEIRNVVRQAPASS